MLEQDNSRHPEPRPVSSSRQLLSYHGRGIKKTQAANVPKSYVMALTAAAALTAYIIIAYFAKNIKGGAGRLCPQSVLNALF